MDKETKEYLEAMKKELIQEIDSLKLELETTDKTIRRIFLKENNGNE